MTINTFYKKLKRFLLYLLIYCLCSLLISYRLINIEDKKTVSQLLDETYL